MLKNLKWRRLKYSSLNWRKWNKLFLSKFQALVVLTMKKKVFSNMTACELTDRQPGGVLQERVYIHTPAQQHGVCQTTWRCSSEDGNFQTLLGSVKIKYLIQISCKTGFRNSTKYPTCRWTNKVHNFLQTIFIFPCFAVHV